MNVLLILGFTCLVAGSACIYLASPHQRWLSRPWAALPSRLSGLALLALGLLLLAQELQLLTAILTASITLMTAWISLPYIGALLPVSGKK